jgi:hypothetical protein
LITGHDSNAERDYRQARIATADEALLEYKLHNQPALTDVQPFNKP